MPENHRENANETVVRTLFEQFFNQGDEAVVDRLVHEKYDFHNGSAQAPRTREAFKLGIGRVRQAFPDMHWEIGLLVASGDMVAVRSTMTATHRGDFMGVPATGRKVVTGIADFYRLDGGLIVEHWDVVDQLAVLLRIDAGLPPEITRTAERWGALTVQ